MNAMPKFDCLLLAADREGHNPVAQAAGVPCKSLALIEGKPMLMRVLKALEQCPTIGRCLLLGPAWEILANHPIVSLLKTPRLEWIAPEPSPSLSVLAGFSRIPEDRPILLTTADLAFPATWIFEDFCSQAAAGGGDVAVGLIPYPEVVARYPKARRTILKFADGSFCTCNLFAFLTPKGRRLVEFWRQLEQERKRPWRLILALGTLALVGYLLGRLRTQELARRVEKKLGLKVNFVILPYPAAAIDVDTEDDLRLVRKLLETGAAVNIPPARAENSAQLPQSTRADRCGPSDRRARWS